MITITDISNATTSQWEVVDTTGKLPNSNFTYNPNCIYGYDRGRVLQQIVEVYSTMSGYKNEKWQTPGKIFTLS